MKKRYVFPLAVLLSLALTACGASSSSRNPMSNQVMAEKEKAAVSEDYYDLEQMEKSETMAAGMEESGGLAGSGPSVQPQVDENRKLIRTVYIQAETNTFDELLKQIQDQIASLGGYVEESEVTGSSLYAGGGRSYRYADLKVRIPSDHLDGFVTAVEGQSNVTNKSESAEDITLRYSDIESRKKSLEIEQDRIWALLEKADSLDAVIALEQRLSDIRYELESYESQLRLYDNQVEYSIVHLSISEVLPLDYTPTQPESVGTRISKGFRRNMERVGEAAVNLFVGLVSTSPVWFPLLLVALAFAYIMKKRGRQVKADRKEQNIKKQEERIKKQKEPKKEDSEAEK